MPSDNEVQRLAAMCNQLRPEWPVKSLVTFIMRDHAARPYRDLAVALAWVATDARTKTPARLSEAGPWWTATSMTEGTGPGQSRMRCADHPEHHAGHCPSCIKAAEGVLKPADFPMPRKRPGYVPKPTMLTADPADLSAARDKTDADLKETS